MSYVYMTLLMMSLNQKIYPQIPETSLICMRFILDLSLKISRVLHCEEVEEISRDVWKITPLNCTEKTDRLPQMCRYILGELQTDNKKWDCKKSVLKDKDKEEICESYLNNI